MKTKIILAAVVLAAMSSLSHAAFLDGSKLNGWLSAYARVNQGRAQSGDFQDASAAMAYIQGVSDAYQGIVICASPSATVGQIVAITQKYMDAHPELWTRSASSLVGAALSQAFPCQK